MADAAASTTASRTATFPKKALAAGLAAFSVLAGMTVAGSSEAQAASGFYNVRNGPGTNHPIIGSLYNPTCRNSHSRAINPNGHGAWNKTIASNGNHGYIFNDGWCL